MKKLLALLLLTASAISCAKTVDVVEINCLAENIYHEARGESYEGQVMVAYTTINRVKDPRWKPKTICGIVHQPKQFSWTISISNIKEREAYHKALELASTVYDNYKEHPEEIYGKGVNHYLRCDIRKRVKWWRNMEFLGQIDNHCFYKGY